MVYNYFIKKRMIFRITLLRIVEAAKDDQRKYYWHCIQYESNLIER